MTTNAPEPQLGADIKKLGFGLMRLPQLQPQAQGEKGAIDIEQTKQMVDMFLDAGFTYFDTAWAYEGSEEAIRQALVERHPRESYQLATKSAAWVNCTSREEAEARFDESLDKGCPRSRSSPALPAIIAPRCAPWASASQARSRARTTSRSTATRVRRCARRAGSSPSTATGAPTSASAAAPASERGPQHITIRSKLARCVKALGIEG